MYNNPAEQLYDYSGIIRIYLAEYYERVVTKKSVTDTPFEKYKGLAVSIEESENIFEELPFELSEGGKAAAAKLSEQIDRAAAESENNGIFLPFSHVCSALKLDNTDRLILALSLMPLINTGYEKTYGYLNDNVNSTAPTLELALELFAGGLHGGFSRLRSPLTEYIFEPYDDSILKTPLKPKKYFSELFLTGVYPDKSEFMRRRTLSEKGIVCYEKEFCEISSIMTPSGNIAVFVEGASGSGRRQLLAQCALENGAAILEIDLAKYRAAEDKKAARSDITCELLLRRCYACVCGVSSDDDTASVLSELCGELSKAERAIFICTENAADIKADLRMPVYTVRLPELSREKSRELWGLYGIDKKTAYAAANRYRFTPKNISDAAAFAVRRADGKDESSGQILAEACRAVSARSLRGKAELIESRFTLDDLIIPDEEKEQINEALAHIRYRHIVYDEWNFGSRLEYGKGLNVMFAGPPGTGKTMAAAIVARELGLCVYRVDISKVLSKYIGETEKSLGEIFDAAERGGAALFFDETDALFGKRSEIKDSHDKYANVETSFLLQRLETFGGVVLMSTNLIENIDEAFMRRINYVIRFPLPDAEQRLRLWKGMFPAEMPADGGIDLDFLAERFEISGGIIKNAVMSAAFLAAEEGSSVNMGHLLKAVKKQLAKQGRVLLKEDFGKYAMFI